MRSELKNIGLDNDEIREVIENLRFNCDDFEAGNYRFISDDIIDDVMQDELGSDEYILGCFNSWFLADVLGIDKDVIEAMQSAEAYEAIGKLVISMGKLEELQVAYRQADGYGNHFGHYDGYNHEATICGHDFHIFRIN